VSAELKKLLESATKPRECLVYCESSFGQMPSDEYVYRDDFDELNKLLLSLIEMLVEQRNDAQQKSLGSNYMADSNIAVQDSCLIEMLKKGR